MNGAISHSTTNEISILRGVNKMTIGELEELSSKIQEVLDSKDVEAFENSDTRKVNIKSQEISISIGVKKLTSNELKQLRLKVQETLISHNMKFIKNRGAGRSDLKYQKILKSHGSKIFSTISEIYKSPL